MARPPSSFLSLDHEPKTHGPPPAYRSGTVTETDTFSDYSVSSGLGKRRGSWVNLVESDENLNRHKVNCYPKVKKTVDAAQQVPSSRTSSQLAYVSDNYQINMMNSNYALPLKAAPGPAGTVPPSIITSRAPSVVVTTPAVIQQRPSSAPMPRKKRNRLQEWLDKTHCSCKKACCVLCLISTILLAVFGIILALVLTQVLRAPKTAQISWMPPEQYRNGQNQPVRINMDTEGNQVGLRLIGAMPFKGNYMSYYDFSTNRVAIIDETLKSNGKVLTCFVMPLDRSLLRDQDAMRKAVGVAASVSRRLRTRQRSKLRNSQTQGWHESWNYLPSPITMNGQQMFSTPIKECEGARWVQLEYAGTNQKNRKCSDCFDFCLPDYGIERDPVRGDEQLNIVKRVCFYLFVPEWRNYAQANTMEQNQRDFETYYRNRNHLTTAYGGGGSDSKWINLQGVPQAIRNVTGNLAGNLVGNLAGQAANTAAGVVNTVGDVAQGVVQGVRAGVFGQNMPDQQGYQNGNDNNRYNYNMQPNQNQNSMSPGAFGPSNVNGVMNMNGVNEQNRGNSYNTNQEGYNVGAYGINSQNLYPNMNGYSSEDGDRNQRNPQSQDSSRSSSAYWINSGNRPESQQYPNIRQDTDRDNNVPYTNGNNFGMTGGFSSRSSQYPDSNGVNPPSGYVPQGEMNIQGIAGMQQPRESLASRHGYVPDIMPANQNNQNQRQLVMPHQGWQSG